LNKEGSYLQGKGACQEAERHTEYPGYYAQQHAEISRLHLHHHLTCSWLHARCVIIAIMSVNTMFFCWLEFKLCMMFREVPSPVSVLEMHGFYTDDLVTV
jgi:hypothetical protein